MEQRDDDRGHDRRLSETARNLNRLKAYHGCGRHCILRRPRAKEMARSVAPDAARCRPNSSVRNRTRVRFAIMQARDNSDMSVSPRDEYLDGRQHAAGKLYHLRHALASKIFRSYR